MMRRRNRLLLTAWCIISVLAAVAARAETAASVQEDVPGERAANRHRLILQNSGRHAQLFAVSCRVQDTAALGMAIDLGLQRQWKGPQQIVVVRDGVSRRNVEFTGSENFVVLGGKPAIDLVAWALAGTSVAFQHPAMTASFDLAAHSQSIARFRQLCKF